MAVAVANKAMRIIRGNSLGEMAMRRRGGNGTERRLAAGLWALAALAAVAAVGLTALPAGATLPIGADGATIAPMLERVTPAVVNISVRSHTSVHNPLLQDPFFRQFFNVPDVPERREQMSAGSGVIIDAAASCASSGPESVELVTPPPIILIASSQFFGFFESMA